MHVLIRASRAESRASSVAAAAAANGEPNVEADSDGWRPAAEDAIQWTGECGDELRMDEVADDVIGPVLRRRRPRLLRLYLRDRLEWTEKKRRAAKLRKGQLAVRKAAMLTDEDATEDDVARVDAEAAEAREEVRRLGAAVGAMASLLGRWSLRISWEAGARTDCPRSRHSRAGASFAGGRPRLYHHRVTSSTSSRGYSSIRLPRRPRGAPARGAPPRREL